MEENLWTVIQKGGWTMIPLGLCSIIALAIVAHRIIWGPTRRRVFDAGLQNTITDLLNKSRFDELLGVCRSHSSPLARLTETALEKAHRPRPELLDALEITGKKEAIKLTRFLGTLGIIAAVSPLLGLLGTVSGMIETFSVINSEGVGDASALAGGISEALITTATGLTIAIPALVFYRYFSNRSKDLIVELESFAVKVAENLVSAPSAKKPPSPNKINS